MAAAAAAVVAGVEEAWFHAGDGVTSAGSSGLPDASPLELPSPLLLLPLSAWSPLTWSAPPWWMSSCGGWARGSVGGVGSGGSTMGPSASPLPGSDSTRTWRTSMSSNPESYSGKAVVKAGGLPASGLGVDGVSEPGRSVGDGASEDARWSAGVGRAVGSSGPRVPGPGVGPGSVTRDAVTSCGVPAVSEAARGVGAAASNPGFPVTACTASESGEGLAAAAVAVEGTDAVGACGV